MLLNVMPFIKKKAERKSPYNSSMVYFPAFLQLRRAGRSALLAEPDMNLKLPLYVTNRHLRPKPGAAEMARRERPKGPGNIFYGYKLKKNFHIIKV